MHYTHNIDPTLLHLGPLQIRWYGLMYLTGFVLGYRRFVKRYKQGFFALTPTQSQDFITYLMIGMMFGARLTYVFIYNWDYYKTNLLEIPAIWQGGLSYHGAAIGFVVAMILFAKKYSLRFWHLADHVGVGAALGVFFGRLGNFANGELWGRTSDVAWAMIFPAAGDNLPRHPSQLYQAFCEGLFVFLILLFVDYRERKSQVVIEEKTRHKETQREVTWKRTGIVGSWYLILYGIGRFVIEFFREPDRQLGYYFGWMTMGQILCSFMIIAGFVMLWMRMKTPHEQKYTIAVEA